MSNLGPILIIDDDNDECEMMQEILTDLQIKNVLRSFNHGKQALEYLLTTEEKPFLILSDINMPGMSGLELRKRINETPLLQEKSIPFVFLTTSASPPTIKQAFAMSVQGFFEKPHLISGMKVLINEIYHYWSRCKHPNN